jgi:hypothetical protein
MKVLTAHQSVYLPWLGLFHKIALADEFVYMDDVKHSKSYVINRNSVKHPAAHPHRLTVPLVRGHDDNQLIRDLEIDNRERWALKHREVLRNFYRTAPFYVDYADVLDFYIKPYERLADLNFDMLRWFLERLGITTPVHRASSLQVNGRKNDYLIGLCHRTDCDMYLFGSSGHDYADLDQWQGEGIAAAFQHYEHPQYAQINGPFVSHLSVIDLMFNCGPESLAILLSGNVDRRGVRAQAAEASPS